MSAFLCRIRTFATECTNTGSIIFGASIDPPNPRPARPLSLVRRPTNYSNVIFFRPTQVPFPSAFLLEVEERVCPHNLINPHHLKPSRISGQDGQNQDHIQRASSSGRRPGRLVPLCTFSSMSTFLHLLLSSILAENLCHVYFLCGGF